MIVKAGRARNGADNFDGYEITLDTQRQVLVLGQHRHDWRPISTTPCEIPTGKWIPLVVRMSETKLEVLVDGKSVVQYEDTERPLRSGTIGLRQWQRDAKYQNLWVKTGGQTTSVPFAKVDTSDFGEISGMWRPVREGSAAGKGLLETTGCLAGNQSQRITFISGNGAFGIENKSLNRWGMCFRKGRNYEGFLSVKAEMPTDLYVALESSDGKAVYAEQKLKIDGDGWHNVNFTLAPNDSDASGRFSIKLKQPGSVVLGYAFLQPGEWGRFKGLPIRRDVTEGLINQGITVLRYGGSMVNHGEYRWKNMVGPREKRRPTAGTGYRYSSNTWGIPDFMSLCEAAGFLYIPDFNINETPQDMADFIEYAKGPVDSKWGRVRAEDGHPAPYKLTHIQLGNEERVDENYYQKFKVLAEVIWAKDKNVTLVVGDFCYVEPITDPDNIGNNAAGLKNLDAQRKILELTKTHNREVWFDVHIGTNSPELDSSVVALPSFIDAIDKLSNGAKHKVVVFELNAGCHNIGRAVSNARAINNAFNDGRLPVVASANCLQPDGQNDNEWDQGLLFLNPSKVWYQPPGLVTQMISRNYQTNVVPVKVEGDLNVAATRSKDGKTLVLQIVNTTDHQIKAGIDLQGFMPKDMNGTAEWLAAPVDAVNTADSPENVMVNHGKMSINEDCIFSPYSFTILRIE